LVVRLDTDKIYVQPLGLLKGFTHCEQVFKKLAGGDIYFSVLKIISRTAQGINEEMVSVSNLDNFLEGKSTSVRAEIKMLLARIESPRQPLSLNNGLLINWQEPVIQGVLNVTPDSFSDGGEHAELGQALSHARQMISAGADIIDVGGETTKPGAKAVSIEGEKSRVLPAIRRLAPLNIPLSIDSRNAEVMKDAIRSGAHIINDVSALSHDRMSIDVVKKADVPVILMHAQGSPETMQDDPQYDHVLLDIYDYLERRIKVCINAGIDKDRIIVDPGIGFGKTVEHNLAIINGLAIFHGLGVPLLIGTSRKSFIGKIAGDEVATKRIPGSIASMLLCLEQGAQIVRVHDVEQTKQAIFVWRAAHRVE
jgi:dihydropteroate synthase